VLSVDLPGSEIVNLREKSDIEDILDPKNDESANDYAANSIDSPAEDGTYFIL